MMQGKSVLVVRGRGGFGDLAMISRSLRKLQQAGCHVGIVLDEKWHGLFDDWKDLGLYKGEEGVWDQVIDIGTPCPAAEIEDRWIIDTREPSSRSTVPVDRLSIFANRLGVQLSPEEHIPYIALDQGRSPDIKGPAVYVQMKAAETYRDWNHMEKIAKGLVAKGVQVWTQGGHVDGAREFKGSIMGAVALMKACVLVISPDSFAVHAAAAVGTPCVAVMGPIGAEARIGHYPYASAIMVDLPCLPCWRSENKLCNKNGSLASWCMQHLHEGAVHQHVMERLKRALEGEIVPIKKYVKAKSDQPRLQAVAS